MTNSATNTHTQTLVKLVIAVIILIGNFIAVASIDEHGPRPITYFPIPDSYNSVNYVDTSLIRRRLAPFQLCLPCKCCTAVAAGGVCSTMPCCFGIDCQIPNKPFGFCAFVPKTCNCTSCA